MRRDAPRLRSAPSVETRASVSVCMLARPAKNAIERCDDKDRSAPLLLYSLAELDAESWMSGSLITSLAACNS